MVSYPYHAEFSRDGSIVRRPVVPLNINGYPFTGLIDSGSDIIVIPVEVAEALDLKYIGNTSLSQMNGDEMPCSIAEIEIEFGTDKAPQKFKAQVLVAEAQRIILGRTSFFNNFRITFDELHFKLHFKPSKQKEFL
jgi:predicted aspartyl protease